jgi:hypothetical protein
MISSAQESEIYVVMLRNNQKVNRRYKASAT